MEQIEKVDEIEFEGELFMQTLYHSESIGVQKSIMRLYAVNAKTHVIEWETNGGDIVEIGVWTDGTKVTEYDGVMELPKRAIELLEKNGFNCDEVKQ